MEDFILVGLKMGNSHRYLPGKWMQFYPGLKIDWTGNKVEIADNKKFLPDFFGPRVSAVSAIVGMNGSGKSSTLNYIKQLFIKEKSGLRHSGDDVLIFIQDDQIHIYLPTGEKSNLQIKNGSSISHVVLTYHDHPKLFDKIKNYTAAFYTNGLDLDQKEIETTNYYNISTGFLLGNLGKVNKNIRSKKIIAQAAVKRYQYTEFIRQLDFLSGLNDRPKVDIPFKPLSEVVIVIRETLRNDYSKLQKKLDKILKESKENYHPDRSREFIQLMRDADVFFTKEKKDTGSEKQFYELVLAENILIMLFEYMLAGFPLINQTAKEDLVFIALDFFKEDINYKFLHFTESNIIRQILEGSERSAQVLNTSKSTQDLLKGVNDLKNLREFSKELMDLADITSGVVTLSLQHGDFDRFINKFYTLYRCDFISYKWPKLSAGEESLLAFFSRLDFVLNNSKSRDILLLIDEGDLYFHPEWQRNYLHYIIDFLNRGNGDFNRIQILLTTHSPFLVSDIPHEYQVYLGDQEDGDTEIKARGQETFGGNLYSLFSNNFFLGGSTTSEFARRKIKNEILAVIDDRALMTQPMLIRLRTLIDKIGDPVVREIINLRLQERSKKE